MKSSSNAADSEGKKKCRTKTDKPEDFQATRKTCQQFF